MKQTAPTENPCWKPYENKAATWTNPLMKACTFPGCYFVDSDWEAVTSHFVSSHREPTIAGNETAGPLVQGKLTGGAITREDVIEQTLLKLPEERLQCVYCFSKQSSRAARQFNAEGKLLKTAKCVDCAKTMELETMRIMRDPFAFGKFIGEYRGWFYKVDHDDWMKGLKRVYAGPAITQFWNGYAEGNPKFAERQLENQRLRETGGDVKAAEAKRKAQEKDDFEKETAKYRLPDNSIDWEKMAKDAEKHLQGALP